MATCNYWQPTSGNLASTDANWSLGHKPDGSENTFFVGSFSNANCTIDYAMSVEWILLSDYSGTVTQAAAITANGSTTPTVGGLDCRSGRFVESADGITASAFYYDDSYYGAAQSYTANASATHTINGSWTCGYGTNLDLGSSAWTISGSYQAGTSTQISFKGNTATFTLTGTGKDFAACHDWVNTANGINKIIVSGSYTVNGTNGGYVSNDVQVTSTGSLTVASVTGMFIGKSLSCASGGTLACSGTGYFCLMNQAIEGFTCAGTATNINLYLLFSTGGPNYNSTTSRTMSAYPTIASLNVVAWSGWSTVTTTVLLGAYTYTWASCTVSSSGTKDIVFDWKSGTVNATNFPTFAKSSSGSPSILGGTGTRTFTSNSARNIDWTNGTFTCETCTLVCAGTGAVTVKGSVSYCGFTFAPSCTTHFTHGTTTTFTGKVSVGGAAVVIDSDSAGSSAAWILSGTGAYSDLAGNCSFKDIDASGGHTVWAYGSTLVSGTTKIVVNVLAGKWVNEGADNLASTPSNWTGGPVVSTTHVLYDTVTDNCTLDFAMDCYGISITSNYVGVVTQGAFDITTRAGGYSQAAGTFNGYMSVAHNFFAGYPTAGQEGGFTLSGGTFNCPLGAGSWPPTGLLICGNFSAAGGTFVHSSSYIYWYQNVSTTTFTFDTGGNAFYGIAKRLPAFHQRHRVINCFFFDRVEGSSKVSK